MISLARWPGPALAGLLLTAPWHPAARAGEPEPTAAKMPASVVVKPGKADPEARRPFAPTSFTVEVGAVQPRATVPVEVELRNTSAAPIKLLGGTRGCTPRGCAQVLGPFPRTILPGEAAKIGFLYVAPAETCPPFSLEVRLYVAGLTTCIVPIDVTGTVAPVDPPQ